jgi:hypothetical protein
VSFHSFSDAPRPALAKFRVPPCKRFHFQTQAATKAIGHELGGWYQATNRLCILPSTDVLLTICPEFFARLNKRSITLTVYADCRVQVIYVSSKSRTALR